jgi:hypothetical protein
MRVEKQENRRMLLYPPIVNDLIKQSHLLGRMRLCLT